jgi:hypothetical protein
VDPDAGHGGADLIGEGRRAEDLDAAVDGSRLPYPVEVDDSHGLGCQRLTGAEMKASQQPGVWRQRIFVPSAVTRDACGTPRGARRGQYRGW